MKKSNKPLTVIVKVAGNFCNLRCSYCFYCRQDQETKTIMSLDLSRRMIEQALATGMSPCTFIWHGGEPMLAGLPFYKQIVEIQKKHKLPEQEICNGMQTNATLITDEWAEFFKLHDFKIGVSLDGCEKSHNRFRVYPDGTGSFQQVVEGIRNLQQKGLRPGYIQTVSRDNLPDLESNFRFFTEELGAKNWGMNYLLDLFDGNISDQSVKPEKMAEHIIRCIELWLARNDPELQIREIESFFRPFTDGKPIDCDFDGSCGRLFCVEWNGEVFPCDRISNLGKFCLGNLQNQTFAEILATKKEILRKQLAISFPEECQKCRWLKYCNNGCPHHRVPDVHGKYYYCDARKKVFEYVEQIAVKFGLCEKTQQ